MTDPDPATGRDRAQAMRGVRLARARMIRRRIISGSLALFVAAWLLIAIVLVSGNDPALSKDSKATTVASSPATTTTTTTTPTSSGSTSSASSGVSSVTTSQS